MKKNKMETWETINGYENYQISNYGSVRSLSRIVKRRGKGFGVTKERILKPYFKKKKKRKYYMVRLSKNGKAKDFQVHRMVGLCFVDNPENKPHVNHIDNNPLNNHYKNLEWCTQRENVNHGNTFRKYTSKYPGVCWRKDRNKWQAEISMNGKHKYLGKFINEMDAAEAYRNALKT